MLGVVADDLTGALDSAMMLHAGGVRAPVVVGVEAFRRQNGAPSTIILDVDSRGGSPDEAYRKVREATRALLDAGYHRIYKKMSSTCQGHIGREVDAVMDEAGVPFTIVVPAFPANGRVTRLGCLYVDGVPLSETGVGRHPTSPITDSYLPRVLQAQTKRPVGLVDFATVQRGIAHLKAEFARLALSTGIAIVDVTCEEDLRTVAEAARSLVISAGGSALAGQLPSQEYRNEGAAPPVPARTMAGCLVMAGSVSPVTAAQVACSLESGLEGACLDVLSLLDPARRGTELLRAVEFALAHLCAGSDALLYTSPTPESQAAAAESGLALGLGPLQVGASIAGAMAEVAARVIAETGLNRLIVAGGDTSAAVCRRLGLDVHQVLEEVQTGVPLSLSSGRQTLVTVLKSGNFGTPDFFARALERVARSG